MNGEQWMNWWILNEGWTMDEMINKEWVVNNGWNNEECVVNDGWNKDFKSELWTMSS